MYSLGEIAQIVDGKLIGDESPALVRRRAEYTVKWATQRLKRMYFPKDPEDIIGDLEHALYTKIFTVAPISQNLFFFLVIFLYYSLWLLLSWQKIQVN